MNWTHKLKHCDGGEFFARLGKDSRMYVSDVTHPGGFVECSETSYSCSANTVEEHFSSPYGVWVCNRINQFKGNK